VQPPAEAVIVGRTPAVPPTETPATVAPASRLDYAQIAPGLLARSLFTTKEAGPLTVEIVDILVAPGTSAQLPAAQFAALLEIEAGAPLLALDGKPVALDSGKLLGIDQGRSLTIDNRQERRAAVARLIKLQAPGNQ
jgi:hypothetical protein